MRSISPGTVELYNVYAPERAVKVAADSVVMATARQSLDHLARSAELLGVPVDTIGDALAPRGTYEAVFEGHRLARKL